MHRGALDRQDKLESYLWWDRYDMQQRLTRLNRLYTATPAVGAGSGTLLPVVGAWRTDGCGVGKV